MRIASKTVLTCGTAYQCRVTSLSNWISSKRSPWRATTAREARPDLDFSPNLRRETSRPVQVGALRG